MHFSVLFSTMLNQTVLFMSLILQIEIVLMSLKMHLVSASCNY